jgi:hypothetical protein
MINNSKPHHFHWSFSEALFLEQLALASLDVGQLDVADVCGFLLGSHRYSHLVLGMFAKAPK